MCGEHSAQKSVCGWSDAIRKRKVLCRLDKGPLEAGSRGNGLTKWLRSGSRLGNLDVLTIVLLECLLLKGREAWIIIIGEQASINAFLRVVRDLADIFSRRRYLRCNERGGT